MTLTRSAVRAARLAWSAYLKEPDRKKGQGALDKGDGHRCCLGHGCIVIGLEPQTSPGTSVAGVPVTPTLIYYGAEQQFSMAPDELVGAMGLWSASGATRYGAYILPPDPMTADVLSLTDLNDWTSMTPQQIGAYIRSVIDGGDDTPFRPLTDYPEE